MLARGGFTTSARVAFTALAGAAALASLVAGGRGTARAGLLHPLPLVLAAAAAAGALSSLWTVGVRGDSLEWALLPAGYAALAAAVLAAPDRAAMRHAVLAALGLCAFASGLVGLIGAATFDVPQAFRPSGAWRPGGTIEYAPGLALLMVCALPLLLRVLGASGRRLGLLAATPALVAGAVLGLSHSRLGVGMALVVLALALVAPQRTVRVPRGDATAAVALVVLSAVAARACLGGRVPLGAEAEGWRLAVVIAACLLAPLAWLALRAIASRVPALVLAAALAGLLAAGTVGGFAGSAALTEPGPRKPSYETQTRQRPHPIRADVLHGRRAIWEAGIEAFALRPLAGHGAGAFLTATLDIQERPITTYAHNLPLELAVELGLLGALLALALYLVVARACWRSRAVPDAWLLAVPAAAFLLANLVDWPWHIAGLGAVWAAATAALVAELRAGHEHARA